MTRPTPDTRRAAIASLTAHLRRPEEHGRLAFHPECPLCSSERLAGALPRDAVMGHRTQAVLAASVLALSTASPAVVLAQEPDQQHEGAAVPDPGAASEVPAEAVFDPGGSATDVPLAAATAPEPAAAAPPVDDDAGVLEPEPETDEAPPAADAGDGSGTRAANGELPVTAAVPAAPTPPTEPPAAESGTGAIAPSQDASQPVPQPDPPAADEDGSADEGKPASERERSRPVQTVPLTTPGPPSDSADADPRPAEPAPLAQAPSEGAANAPLPQAQPAAAIATAPAATTAATTQTRSTAAVNRGQAARRGDRTHVVRAGESLWSIADDMLGVDASAARIAREVNRLWELNRSRIATGNPDLLAVGTKLVLR